MRSGPNSLESWANGRQRMPALRLKKLILRQAVERVPVLGRRQVGLIHDLGLPMPLSQEAHRGNPSSSFERSDTRTHYAGFE